MQTILIIHPDDDDRRLLLGLLSYADVRVLTAANLGDGLDQALRETPDLIVTEFMIPGGGGHCAVEELKRREALRGVPVIVWATEGIGDARARTEVSGGRFLDKSSPPLVLIQEVTRALDARVPPEPASGAAAGGTPRRPVLAE